MSRGIFINALDTYIGMALYEEFLGANPEESEYEIYSTYFNKQSSDKPAHVKKMLKRIEKPILFKKYMLDKFDVMVYDMHCGKLEDLKFGISSLTKKPLQSEKVVIVISSILSWGKTPPKIVEDKPEDEDDQDKDQPVDAEVDQPVDEEEEKEDEDAEIDNHDEAGNLIEVLDAEGNLLEEDDSQYKPNLRRIKKELRKPRQPKKEIKYKRVGYEESEFSMRVPMEAYAEYKAYEDELLAMNFENLTVYVICAGLPYGNSETIFNYFFKSAWLQSPEELPYFESGENIVPTIHVKDLTKVVRTVIDKKPEQRYIFAFDNTADKTAKGLISSISRSIGSGKTQAVPLDTNYLKNLRLESSNEMITDTKIKDTLQVNLTEFELNWQNFLHLDVMLKPSPLLEEGEEWHCGDFAKGLPKLLKEFCSYRNLRPLKIVLNCEDKYERCQFAERLARFYNIPIVNYESVVNMLSLNPEYMTEEEIAINRKYLDLKARIEKAANVGNSVRSESLYGKEALIDKKPSEEDQGNDQSKAEDEPKKNELLPPVDEETEIMFETLQNILQDNACVNRGYVLEGLPKSLDDAMRIYNRKIEIKQEDEELGEDQDQDEEEKDEEAKDKEEKQDAEDNQEINKSQDQNKSLSKSKEQQQLSMSHISNAEEKPERPLTPFYDKQDDIEREMLEAERRRKKELKKRLKRKPKQFKFRFAKKLLPESVISICFKEDLQVRNPFWEVEEFYQRNKIEVLNVTSDRNFDEVFEIMRIYVERNTRPFNYFKDNEESIKDQRGKLVERKFNQKVEAEKRLLEEQKQAADQEEREYWERMEARIANILKDKEALDQNSQEFYPTRQFLLLNVMPILTRGMLEVCKIDPIDPVDYLADFLFEKSTD